MSPTTRKARRSASHIGPLGVADRPARVRAGEPSRRDTYGRERPPPRRGGGCATPGATPGATPTPSADRASGHKGGVAPVQSLPAGASRVVRSRTKNPNGDSEKWTRGVPHPTLSYWLFADLSTAMMEVEGRCRPNEIGVFCRSPRSNSPVGWRPPARAPLLGGGPARRRSRPGGRPALEALPADPVDFFETASSKPMTASLFTGST